MLSVLAHTIRPRNIALRANGSIGRLSPLGHSMRPHPHNTTCIFQLLVGGGFNSENIHLLQAVHFLSIVSGGRI